MIWVVCVVLSLALTGAAALRLGPRGRRENTNLLVGIFVVFLAAFGVWPTLDTLGLL